MSGKGGQKSETSKQAPTRKTKAAVDRRQNNKMLRQCPSGITQRPPHHAIAVPTAMQSSHKDNVRRSAAGRWKHRRIEVYTGGLECGVRTDHILQ